ncbi:MAG: Slp family lipoprotein [Nitrospirota bacterium]|jgi:hypothetical protein
MRLTSCKSWLVVAIGLIAACSSQRVIPEALEPLVERAVMFHEVVAAPDSYQGKVVVFGGEVLKAKRLKEGTQIELLQLPLDRGERPILNRQQSQGRFLAIQQEFLDPATIVEGGKDDDCRRTVQVKGRTPRRCRISIPGVNRETSASMASAIGRRCSTAASILDRGRWWDRNGSWWGWRIRDRILIRRETCRVRGLEIRKPAIDRTSSSPETIFDTPVNVLADT